MEKGVPFREAHEAVGRAAAAAAREGRLLSSLTPEEWRAFHSKFDRDVLGRLEAEASLARRELPGAPGPRQVRRQLARWEKALGPDRPGRGRRG